MTKSKIGVLLSPLVLMAGTLSAGPIYSCSAGSLCDGNTYAVWVVSQTPTSYVLEVDVQVTDSYTGSTSDSINAISVIPDINGSFTAASLMSSPAGTWSYEAGGLNAGGCNGHGAPFICSKATGLGAPLFTDIASVETPNLLSWQFDITGAPPVDGDTTHLKYHYVNTDGGKVGSLGSFDVGIQCIGATCDGGGSGASVPEPATLSLAGFALAGLGLLRLRKRSS